MSPRSLLSLSRKDGLFYFLIGAVAFLLLGLVSHQPPPQKLSDFKAVYYASHALLDHRDPYAPANLKRIYLSFPDNDAHFQNTIDAVTLCVNLPTTVVLFKPLAMLPWPVAHVLWTALTACAFLLAAWLMWIEGAAWSPRLTGILICLIVSGSQALLEVGNAAGLVVSLAVIGAWCFVREKYVIAGIVCMGVALVIKPQDAGFVWLYFLLAGGTARRRAVQTLAVVVPIACLAAIAMADVSPYWMAELHRNVLAASAPGQQNNPLNPMVDPIYRGSMIVSLQTVTGLFSSAPDLYNAVVYVLLAPLFLIWLRRSLGRQADSQPGSQMDAAKAWIALAAIVPLAMLAGYHRQHDTRLLLLAVPACVLLAARAGRIGRLAVAFTAAAALASSNLVLPVFGLMSHGLRDRLPGLGGLLLYVIEGRPVPLALLAMAGFYGWLLLRHDRDRAEEPLTADAEVLPVQ